MKIKDLTGKVKYDFGDLVYLITDPEQLQRMVVGVRIRSSGSIVYLLACGTQETDHTDTEISTECDMVKKTSN